MCPELELHSSTGSFLWTNNSGWWEENLAKVYSITAVVRSLIVELQHFAAASQETSIVTMKKDATRTFIWDDPEQAMIKMSSKWSISKKLLPIASSFFNRTPKLWEFLEPCPPGKVEDCTKDPRYKRAAFNIGRKLIFSLPVSIMLVGFLVAVTCNPITVVSFLPTMCSLCGGTLLQDDVLTYSLLRIAILRQQRGNTWKTKSKISLQQLHSWTLLLQMSGRLSLVAKCTRRTKQRSTSRKNVCFWCCSGYTFALL